jgi:peptide/nickel transport system permease protein
MMLTFVLKRIAFAVLTLVVATALAFVLVHLSGSTPGGVALGMSGTPEQVEAYNIEVGWYDPWIIQYLDWWGQVLQGNLGVSLIDGRPIGPDIAKRLPVTAALAVLGTLVSALVGITMGVVAAVRGGAVDRGITALSGILLSLPAFWVGVLLVYVFAVQMRLLPATGFVPFATNPEAWARSLVLPVLTIAITSAAGLARQTRASMGEALTQEHMRTLRAVGTPTWRIVYVHALRGASLPILASIAIQFIILFGGSVIIEVLFALPGIGQAMQAAVGSADLPFVQALVLVATLVVVVVNLALELLNRVLDPKLRAS